jgi:hypothetical protein
MDRTAAERQVAFRKRMQAKGFRLKHIWVDAEGFVLLLLNLDFLGSSYKVERASRVSQNARRLIICSMKFFTPFCKPFLRFSLEYLLRC